MGSLVESFHDIADGRYEGCRDWNRIEAALIRYEEILEAVRNDSLASDGMEMIEASLREKTWQD